MKNVIMSTQLIISILTLHGMALISPGPDLVLTIKNTLACGKAHGMVTAQGFAIGIGIHCLVSLFGLSSLIEMFPETPRIINILGASYLIWIGIKDLISKKHKFYLENPLNSDFSNKQLKQSFLEGLMTNILNPKAALFIFSLLSSVSGKNLNTSQLMIISLLMMLSTFIWFTAVTHLFGNEFIRLKFHGFFSKLNIIFSLAFILIGLFLLLF